MSIEIPLTRGLAAIVDDADYGRVALAGLWHAAPGKNTMYARRHVVRADGTRTSQNLHAFLTGWSQTDHRNGDGLDNRRANLRPLTDQVTQRLLADGVKP